MKISFLISALTINLRLSHWGVRCCCRLWTWHSANRLIITHWTLNVEIVLSESVRWMFVKFRLKKHCIHPFNARSEAERLPSWWATSFFYHEYCRISGRIRLFLLWNLSLLLDIVESVFALRIISQTKCLFDSSVVVKLTSDFSCI